MYASTKTAVCQRSADRRLENFVTTARVKTTATHFVLYSWAFSFQKATSSSRLENFGCPSFIFLPDSLRYLSAYPNPILYTCIQFLRPHYLYKCPCFKSDMTSYFDEGSPLPVVRVQGWMYVVSANLRALWCGDGR